MNTDTVQIQINNNRSFPVESTHLWAAEAAVYLLEWAR